jgi:hypothetical protein
MANFTEHTIKLPDGVEVPIGTLVAYAHPGISAMFLLGRQ